ncbi:hypothetical protein A3H77_01625 [Candidatus Kaiserbacteria bacterium RIFCSPLOWO2_02_FULL_56_11]|uniref:Uncharacterized protein n=1 Tax=Candidatus Kaiserbacteria bacterium RIFCSPHIGHO2_12_FULL_56_13 TaxID=1798505 RepID=A0A1F6EF03_9BACT|nr:MAG: hypothetical protein A3E65_01890 [Candidatus Kaiserbacteria bacterium RIFCSPHIGHO2_12_FULL_56_13]OGG81675.1 MAG: hypothetical protein A3H77_01625 [Candidatus Kaiserbacteria bacterium RIFCSPLOWO2_02_FULL_56_11]
MRSIAEIKPSLKRITTRKTERGELMRFFVRHLNYSRARDGLPTITMGRMGRILEGIPTADLYYLQKVCSQAKNFSKKFWWEVDPKKHFNENNAR